MQQNLSVKLQTPSAVRRRTPSSAAPLGPGHTTFLSAGNFIAGRPVEVILKGVPVSIKSGYRDKQSLKGVPVSIKSGYRDKQSLNPVI